MTETSLKSTIHDRMTAALKAGDKTTVAALRMLWTAITNQEKDVRHDLEDEEVRLIAAKEVKKRTESIEAFEAAGRTELAERERAERAVIEPYAPVQLSEAEVDTMIDEAIAATGATGPGDMGKVMGQVMGRAKGQVDGGVVQAKVKAKLAAD